MIREAALTAGSLGYRMILGLIHLSYRWGLVKTHELPVPVVSVGNLTWGGTGKTPMVILLAKALRARGRRVAVLTRGYGGDENRLLLEKLAPIPVLVGPDRLKTGSRAIKELGADLLLLDDGFQQWRMKKKVEILMVNGNSPFGNRSLIPRGILREPICEVGRADLIVVTRADLSRDRLPRVTEELKRLNPEAPIFFGSYRPARLIPWPSGKEIPPSTLRKEPVCTLSGIAHPKEFEETVQGLGAAVSLKIRARDHHPYTMGELLRILSRCQRHGIEKVITTTKDAVRIPPLLVEHAGRNLKGIQILALEMDLVLEPDERELLHRIDSVLGR